MLSAWSAKERTTQRITVVCGPHHFRWSTLKAVTQKTLEFLETEYPTFRNPFNKFHKLRKLKSRGKLEKLRGLELRGKDLETWDFEEPGYGSNSLFQIIWHTSGSKCSNPRDHIYAILGMSDVKSIPSTSEPNRYGAGIQINYNKSIKEVYADVLKLDLERYGSLAVLENMLLVVPRGIVDSTLGGQVRGEHLPSWCPNWSVPFVPSIWYRNMSYSLTVEARRPAVSTSSTILRLHGKIISRVKALVQRQTENDSKQRYSSVDNFFQSEPDSMENEVYDWCQFGRPIGFHSLNEVRVGDRIAIFESIRLLLLIRKHPSRDYMCFTLVGAVLGESSDGHIRAYEWGESQLKSTITWKEFDLL